MSSLVFHKTLEQHFWVNEPFFFLVNYSIFFKHRKSKLVMPSLESMSIINATLGGHTLKKEVSIDIYGYMKNLW